MGSSYSDDLYRGSMKEWEGKLRSAIELIRAVQTEVYDNAGSDGALAERLSIAVEVIETALPKKSGGPL